jgi:hypothetical protein
VAAAAAGIVRRIKDEFDENRPDGNPCKNNYVWIEHPNGEWTKYTHMRKGTATDAGLEKDKPVAAGKVLGIESNVGCAHGQHLHFEVAVPDPNLADPIDSEGFIIGGPARNRIPWVCGISGRRFVKGSTVVAGPCPAVDVSVLPTTVRFAPVAIGQGATQICTVVNLGRADATLRVSASPGGSVFAWFPVTKTLARGEFVDVPIRFTPTQLLPAQATMTVTIGGQPSVQVRIAGLGKGPDPEPPRIVAEPASVRFGSVIVEESAIRTCTLVNRGDRATGINVAGSPGGSAFDWFAVHPTLAPGESVAIPIRFTPSQVGTARATLTVNVAGSAPISVALSGDGELGGPLIRVEPPELSLGQVHLGDSSTKEARIVNLSDDKPVTIRIDASPSRRPFRWSAVSAQIPPDGSRTVPVTFEPAVLGRVPATMSIAVTAPTAHVVRLSISGSGTGGPNIP